MPEEPKRNVTRLFNPIPCAEGERERMGGAWIAKREYDYLFRGVLSGVHGTQSAILGTLILKLNTKLRELGTPEYYNPDNETRVAELLANLNFEPRRTDGEPSANDPTSTGGGGVPHNTRGVDGPAPSKPRRSAGPRAKRGTTPSIRRGKSDKKSVGPDHEGVPSSGE